MKKLKITMITIITVLFSFALMIGCNNGDDNNPISTPPPPP